MGMDLPRPGNGHLRLRTGVAMTWNRASTPWERGSPNLEQGSHDSGAGLSRRGPRLALAGHGSRPPGTGLARAGDGRGRRQGTFRSLAGPPRAGGGGKLRQEATHEQAA